MSSVGLTARTVPAMLLLAGLLVCGLIAVLILRSGFGAEGYLRPFMLGGLAFAATGLSLSFGRVLRWGGRLTGVSPMLAGSPHPGFLSDEAGAVLFSNRAARLAGTSGADVAEALALLFQCGDAAGRRLLAEARANRRGRERLTARDGTSWLAEAETWRGGMILWRIVPEARPAIASGGAGDGFAGLPVALLRLSAKGMISEANPAAEILLGKAGLQGQALAELAEGVVQPIARRLQEALRGDSKARSEMARCLCTDVERFVQVTLMREAETGGILAVLSDATELKSLEAQFVQSQKMQAVGQLAGGVAHDFNNLLTAINGHCDLLLLRHSPGDFDHGDLMQIRQNAGRAAALVRQLLAYSRKQTLQPKVIGLGATLGELSQLLRRLLGEKVALVIETDPDLDPVRVDERQFEQVIMNLVVNARDAMPGGGEVRITCRNLHLKDDTSRGRAVISAGDYVVVDVADTGHGMSEGEIEKIFEPFYTTKGIGEGTGLGLSTAYGIIKQTGGYIFADSAPGKGAVFSIYLPPDRSVAADAPLPDNEVWAEGVAAPVAGRGRILLAEDESAVRSFTARALRLKGYQVAEAASGEEALDILRDPGLEFDMFISDVIMPGLDGPSWVRAARVARPDTRILFVSGYAEDVFARGTALTADAAFLPKPYSLNELIRVVGEGLQAA